MSREVKTLVDCACGAHVHPDGSGIEIDYCPLHEAAPDLLSALQDLYLEHKYDSGPLSLNATRSKVLTNARIAIEKAGAIEPYPCKP